MSTHLSRFFRERRIDQGLGLGELARRCGYQNISKGSNRIRKFEDRGEIHPDLLHTLAVALGITGNEIASCVKADRAEWEQWADEPIEPNLVVRLMAAIYSPKSIPDELHSDREAMEQFASDFAKDNRFKVCLVLSRRLRVWFDREGKKCDETVDTFEKSHQPYMRLAGSGRKFLLNLFGG